MDKHKICKICNRRFANGKAMGGHMRSHLAKHPIPPKPNNNPSPPPKYPSSSSSLSNLQTYRSVNREFFYLEEDSEAESSRNLTKTRLKKSPKTIATTTIVASAPPPEPESVSSVTENIFSDKEVALCLLMLSRDKWPLQKGKQVVVEEEEVDKYIRDESEDVDEDANDEDEDESCLVMRTDKLSYKCSTCKKSFRSYQALGGHKASHKKMKISAAGDNNDVVMDQRIFECPFCDKMFDSGQALGGHKKIHFTYLAAPIPKYPAKKFLIDLNLPAPEDDSEVSQV